MKRTFTLGTAGFCILSLGFVLSRPGFSASPSGDAAASAFATALPDPAAMTESVLEDAEGYLGSFGGLDPSAAPEARELYLDGKGLLTAPAVGRVVDCREKTDPVCRAVQILDRGFPERPSIPDHHLTGRDTVVDNPGELPPGAGESAPGCRPIVVTTPDTSVNEVCRRGGWFEERQCRRGVLQTGIVSAGRFLCRDAPPREERFGCSVTSSLEDTSDFLERCFFGTESLKPVEKREKFTEAAASAVWPVRCTAPQKSIEEVFCDEILTIKTVPPCPEGSRVSATAKGGDKLLNDACPLGDTVTAEHLCGAKSQIRLTLNGYPKTVTLRKGRRTVLTHPGDSLCRAEFLFKSEQCTGENCIADWIVTVKRNSTPTGDISGKLIYPNDGVMKEEEVWTDNCSHLRGDGK